MPLMTSMHHITLGGTIFYKRIVKDCSGDGTAGHPGKSPRVFEEKYLHTV